MNALLASLKRNKLVAAAAVAVLAAVFALLSPDLRALVSSAVGVAPVASGAASVDSQ